MYLLIFLLLPVAVFGLIFLVFIAYKTRQRNKKYGKKQLTYDQISIRCVDDIYNKYYNEIGIIYDLLPEMGTLFRSKYKKDVVNKIIGDMEICLAEDLHHAYENVNSTYGMSETDFCWDDHSKKYMIWMDIARIRKFPDIVHSVRNLIRHEFKHHYMLETEGHSDISHLNDIWKNN